MLFNELTDKLGPFLLNEKYFKYQPPASKELLMYDFYVLDYLNAILPYPSKGFRDLNPDLEDSIKDAVHTLYPYLKNELLNVVFYAVCAEMRHAHSNFGNGEGFKDKIDKQQFQLYKTYLKYIIYHGKTGAQKQELTDVFNVRKPSSDVRTPESEKNNDSARNLSYKAANYAIKKIGLDRKDFMEVSEIIFREGSWPTSYGGRAWGDICSGWLLLDRSNKIDPNQRTSISNAASLDKKSETEYDKSRRKVEKSTSVEPMGVAIDHVYDLQHNTDTVFNKLKSYYNSTKGYRWIAQALDHKANVETYHELLDKCSGVVKAMALPVLYNKLGTNWEEEILKERPKSSVTPEVGDRFKDENGYENRIIYSRNNVVYKRTHDEEKGRMTLEDFINKIKSGVFKYSGTNKNYDIAEPVTEPEPTVDSNTSPETQHYDLNLYDKKPITHVNKLKKGDLLVNTIGYAHRNNIKPGVVVKFVQKTYSSTNDLMDVELNGKISKGFNITKFNKLVPKESNNASQEYTKATDKNTKVGDIIKCIDGDDVNFLTTGKLYKVENVTSSYFYVKDDSGIEGGWMHYRFVKADTASETTQEDIQLKAGDIIQSSEYANNTYTVKTINGNSVTVINNISGDETTTTMSHLIEKIKDGLFILNPEIKKDKSRSREDRKDSDYYKSFKVGDIVTPRDVESLKTSGYSESLIPGKEYKILRINPPSFGEENWGRSLLTVKVDDHSSIGAYAQRFKLVKPSQKLTQVDAIKKSRPKERFGVGDSVSVVTEGETFYGKIVEIDVDNASAYVEFHPQNGKGTYWQKYLKLKELKKDIKI
jgi:hypothetical protein